MTLPTSSPSVPSASLIPRLYPPTHPTAVHFPPIHNRLNRVTPTEKLRPKSESLPKHPRSVAMSNNTASDSSHGRSDEDALPDGDILGTLHEIRGKKRKSGKKKKAKGSSSHPISSQVPPAMNPLLGSADHHHEHIMRVLLHPQSNMPLKMHDSLIGENDQEVNESVAYYNHYQSGNAGLGSAAIITSGGAKPHTPIIMTNPVLDHDIHSNNSKGKTHGNTTHTEWVSEGSKHLSNEAWLLGIMKQKKHTPMPMGRIVPEPTSNPNLDSIALLSSLSEKQQKSRSSKQKKHGKVFKPTIALTPVYADPPLKEIVSKLPEIDDPEDWNELIRDLNSHRVDDIPSVLELDGMKAHHGCKVHGINNCSICAMRSSQGSQVSQITSEPSACLSSPFHQIPTTASGSKRKDGVGFDDDSVHSMPTPVASISLSQGCTDTLTSPLSVNASKLNTTIVTVKGNADTAIGAPNLIIQHSNSYVTSQQQQHNRDLSGESFVPPSLAEPSVPPELKFQVNHGIYSNISSHIPAATPSIFFDPTTSTADKGRYSVNPAKDYDTNTIKRKLDEYTVSTTTSSVTTPGILLLCGIHKTHRREHIITILFDRNIFITEESAVEWYEQNKQRLFQQYPP